MLLYYPPLFGGIYLKGAGLGPAITFLYSGPTINLLAIILTARIMGFSIGLARAIGAIGLALVMGLLMACFYRREEAAKVTAAAYYFTDPEVGVLMYFPTLTEVPTYPGPGGFRDGTFWKELKGGFSKMVIKVLGPGCARCQKLEQETREALAELGVAAEVQKVTAIKQIIEQGVFATPGLVINEKFKIAGKIPSQAKIKEWVKEELGL